MSDLATRAERVLSIEAQQANHPGYENRQLMKIVDAELELLFAESIHYWRTTKETPKGN